jgi:hypothetical protein
MAWLTLSDGSVLTVSNTDSLLRACGRAVEGLPLNAEEEALVDLVKQSIDWKGTGDQGMIEAYRAVLLSPVEDEFYPFVTQVNLKTSGLTSATRLVSGTCQTAY